MRSEKDQIGKVLTRPTDEPTSSEISASAAASAATAEATDAERGSEQPVTPRGSEKLAWIKQTAPKVAHTARKTTAAVRGGIERMRHKVAQLRQAEEDAASEAGGSETEMEQKAREIRDRCIAMIRSHMDRSLDEDTQAELGRLLTLLPKLDAAEVVEREQFILVLLDSLLGEEPKLVLARSMRSELERQTQYQSGFLSRKIYAIAGDTSLGCLLVSLVTFLLVYIFVMWLMSPTLYRYGATFGDSYLFLSLTTAAVAGGIISLLTRIRTFADLPVFNPLLIFSTAFFKPVIAIAFAFLIYSVLNSGLIGVAGFDRIMDWTDQNRTAALSVIWVIGFLSGFSERFVNDFVGSVEGRFSPQGEAPPATIDAEGNGAPAMGPGANRNLPPAA